MFSLLSIKFQFYSRIKKHTPLQFRMEVKKIYAFLFPVEFCNSPAIRKTDAPFWMFGECIEKCSQHEYIIQLYSLGFRDSLLVSEFKLGSPVDKKVKVEIDSQNKLHMTMPDGRHSDAISFELYDKDNEYTVDQTKGFMGEVEYQRAMGYDFP